MTYNSIVLSGGGLKGFGLLGGLQYLIDNKHLDNIKYFAGTSIGAVICYFIAIGYSPVEMVIYSITNKVFDSYDIKNINSILAGDGIYDFSIFLNHFEKMTIDKIGYLPTLLELYEKIGKILYICTYNITQKKKEYISYHNYPDMLCIDAIKISCSLPFIFNDCIYKENYYIDGGFVDNCPFTTILNYEDANIIIFNIIQKNTEDFYTKIIDKFYTILMIPINELQDLQFKHLTDNCKLITLELEPKLYEFNISNSEKLELFSSGYNSTKKHLIN
jgi:predicted acylesterase/phospholipase RssA